MKLKMISDVLLWINKCCLTAVLLEVIMFVFDVILRHIRQEFRTEIFKELGDVLDDILLATTKPMVTISRVLVIVNFTVAVILHFI